MVRKYEIRKYELIYHMKRELNGWNPLLFKFNYSLIEYSLRIKIDK